MNPQRTRILVIDDSAIYRQSIGNVLRHIDSVEIVGTAKNGVDALEKIEKLEPDLLTLDIQMPDMNGIELLREIKRRRLRAKAIMVSSFTSQGAQETTEALMEGAFDFILKPSSPDSSENRRRLGEALSEKISAFRESHLTRHSRPSELTSTSSVKLAVESVPSASAACRAVIIGTSTGGPAALKAVLPKLPKKLPVPVLVVQHMPRTYTLSLANRLNEICELDVVEATDRMEATPGKIIIAAGGKQMKVVCDGGRLLVRVTNDPKENGVCPSSDFLIRSAATTLNGNALAVIMTGMGRDGLEGCRVLKQAGGFVFAQSQSDCVVYGMPKAVIDQQIADRILPLGKISPAIVRHIKRSRNS